MRAHKELTAFLKQILGDLTKEIFEVFRNKWFQKRLISLNSISHEQNVYFLKILLQLQIT